MAFILCPQDKKKTGGMGWGDVEIIGYWGFFNSYSIFVITIV